MRVRVFNEECSVFRLNNIVSQSLLWFGHSFGSRNIISRNSLNVQMSIDNLAFSYDNKAL